MGGPPTDAPTPDSGEQIYISSLALIKMLKHGKVDNVLNATQALLLVY